MVGLVSLLLWLGVVAPGGAALEVTGYLSDILCAQMDIGFDGADMRYAPWQHTW
jgi:hypothetical protein